MPRVCDVFDDGAGSTYLVMEHSDALSFHAWIDELGMLECDAEGREKQHLWAEARGEGLNPGLWNVSTCATAVM